VLAFSSLFLFAASDTTSGALNRIFEQLALCPDIQDRLREEIVEATSGRDALSYDELNGLKYLHAVVKETLRLYVDCRFAISAL
jgi:cytochrome P450